MTVPTSIGELSLESDTMQIMASWLTTFFDGGKHDVGGNSQVQFPLARLSFGQSVLPQPLNPAGQTNQPITSILMVFGLPSRAVLLWEAEPRLGITQQTAYRSTSFIFFVRCESQATSSGNARSAAYQTADRLFGILGNAGARKPLTAAGIIRLRPWNPEPIADTNYILLQIRCRATLKYPVLSQVLA